MGRPEPVRIFSGMEEPDSREERLRVLGDLEDLLAVPMAVLGLVWLVLLVVELVYGSSAWTQVATWIIWVIFLLDFLLELTLAPDKVRWLRGQWLTVLSLLAPPFRVFGLVRFVRFVRFARLARGLTLVRLVAAINRGMAALRQFLRRRKAGYAAALTALVVFVGAAGMYVLERDVPGSTLVSYPASVWWTAMLVTTIGSDYWPRTPGGRALCLAIGTYGFAMFGYATAAIASLFVGDGKSGG